MSHQIEVPEVELCETLDAIVGVLDRNYNDIDILVSIVKFATNMGMVDFRHFLVLQSRILELQDIENRSLYDQAEFYQKQEELKELLGKYV